MALILVFQAASQKSAMVFFTGVYKKIQKDFVENLFMVASELWFFFPSIWTKQETRQTQSEGFDPPLWRNQINCNY